MKDQKTTVMRDQKTTVMRDQKTTVMKDQQTTVMRDQKTTVMRDQPSLQTTFFWKISFDICMTVSEPFDQQPPLFWGYF